MRRGPPSENHVRNAIVHVTVSATRIEIVLNELIVVEGQDRVLPSVFLAVASGFLSLGQGSIPFRDPKAT